MNFQLDEQLARDTVSIVELTLCDVRLMNDSHYPWLVLVPQQENCIEIIDLSHDDQTTLLLEMRHCSEALKRLYPDHKLNVANLGNVVSQLHLHIVARNRQDKAWPGPIWGAFPAKPYLTPEFNALKERLQSELTP